MVGTSNCKQQCAVLHVPCRCRGQAGDHTGWRLRHLPQGSPEQLGHQVRHLIYDSYVTVMAYVAVFQPCAVTVDVGIRHVVTCHAETDFRWTLYGRWQHLLALAWQLWSQGSGTQALQGVLVRARRPCGWSARPYRQDKALGMHVWQSGWDVW